MTYLGLAICDNGHMQTAMLRPGMVPDKFCKRCGKPVLTKCPRCNARLRGAPYNAVSAPGFRAPDYCPECGNPLPWTISELNKAKQAIEQHAKEQNVSDADAEAATRLIENMASRSTTGDEEKKARTIAEKFGSAGRFMYELFTDLAAKTIAETFKPW